MTDAGRAASAATHRMSLVFIDTETTGRPKSRTAPLSDLANWPRLVQVAWMVADAQGHETDAQCMIVKPDGFTIPADAARVHGISTERARREGVPLPAVLDLLQAALQAADTVIAHNFEFDCKVTAAEFLRLERPDPFAGRRSFCTMERGAAVTRIPGAYGKFKWPTLTELHTHFFGAAPDVVHDALADVRSCARCYLAMRGRKGATP